MARERRIVEREVGTVERKGGFAAKAVWVVMSVLLALAAGALTGVLGAYYLNNSRFSVEVSALATYRPPQVTTIYGRIPGAQISTRPGTYADTVGVTLTYY